MGDSLDCELRFADLLYDLPLNFWLFSLLIPLKMIVRLLSWAYHWRIRRANMEEHGTTEKNLMRLCLTAFILVASANVPAQVATNPPPVILPTQSPQSVVTVAGNSATLTVGASGVGPFSYQWSLNGTNLPYATNRTLSFTRTSVTNEGDYVAVVSNTYGAATSSLARLHIIPPPTQLLARVLSAAPLLPYRLFVPTNYTSSQRYPLVLFMHGAGEVGSDNLRQLSVHPQALAFVSFARQASSPVFLAAPQCPSGRAWYDPVMLLRLSDLLDALVNEFSIDTNRIYITGLSMGGMGAWALLDTTPTRFAAAIPICGADTNEAGCFQYAQVPIWNFHAADDGTVSVFYSRSMVNALRTFSSSVLYTEYGSGGHVIWPMAYATPGLVEWTLAQTRGNAMAGGPCVMIEQATNLQNRVVSAGLLRLRGSATFDAERITKVSWTNLLTHAQGTASGSNSWSISAIPLTSRSTNTLVVTAASTSRAPSLKGSTTFASALVVQTGPPLRAQIESLSAGIRLHAPELSGPLILQTSTNLTDDAWEETEWTPSAPLEFPSSGTVRFFRLVER